MQQRMRDGQGEATEQVIWYGSTQPLIVDLNVSGETQARKKQHHQLDSHPAQWVATNQVPDGTATPAQGEHQHKEGRKGLKKLQKADIWQFLRFCIVGTLNAVIDFGVLNLLLWRYPTADIWKTLAYNSLAVLLAATNSFFWNKYWTFQQRSPITFQEVYRFLVVAGGTTLMNDMLMWLLGRTFPGIMDSSLAGANVLKLGAIVGTMSISFFGMRLWVFFQQRFAEEVSSLADTKMEKLAGIKLIYDVDTVIVGAIRPARNVEATVTSKPGKPGSSGVTSDPSASQSKRNAPMKTLIIIPTYNEGENLPLLLRQIFTYAPIADVLIVDDNSPDGTGELAEEIRKQNPQVYVLHRPGKLGLGTAYIAGFTYAIHHGYDVVFEMDADFSHDPRYLPNFLKDIEHADLVIGSRYIPGGSTPNWSMIRRLISSSGNIFARFLLGIPVHDCTGGFRCYRSQVLQSVNLDAVQSRGYAFQVELTYRVLKQGFKIVETPIRFIDRRLGTSKMSRKIVIEAFTYVLRTRFSKQAFAPNVSSPSAFSAATTFHLHSTMDSVAPTFVPRTNVPASTPAVAVHVASTPSYVSRRLSPHATNDVILLDRNAVESVSFSLANPSLADLPQLNSQLSRGNIPETRIMQRIALPITPLPEPPSPRGIRPIKLESLD
jgi:dolichol-phosphate mannosyltransferase